MRPNIRQLFFSIAAVATLTLGLSSTANAACPKVGSVSYSDYRCSTPSARRAPCFKTVVTGVNTELNIYSVSIYRNAYYRWEYYSQFVSAC
jgi:hypothetical protein